VPSFSPGTAELEIEGGDVGISPFRFTPGGVMLHVVGGTAAFAIGSAPSAERVTVPSLDYLMAGEPIVNPDGSPSARFQYIWQEMVDRLIATFTAIDIRDTDQESILARLTATEAKAAAAQEQAAAAQQTATAASEAVEDTFTQSDPELGDFYAQKYDYYRDYRG
jgi:hypothetical protein